MTTISRFHRIFYDFLISVKLPSLYAEVLNLVLLTVLVFIVATILNYFFKNSISKIFKQDSLVKPLAVFDEKGFVFYSAFLNKLDKCLIVDTSKF